MTGADLKDVAELEVEVLDDEGERGAGREIEADDGAAHVDRLVDDDARRVDRETDGGIEGERGVASSDPAGEDAGDPTERRLSGGDGVVGCRPRAEDDQRTLRVLEPRVGPAVDCRGARDTCVGEGDLGDLGAHRADPLEGEVGVDGDAGGHDVHAGSDEAQVGAARKDEQADVGLQLAPVAGVGKRHGIPSGRGDHGDAGAADEGVECGLDVRSGGADHERGRDLGRVDAAVAVGVAGEGEGAGGDVDGDLLDLGRDGCALGGRGDVDTEELHRLVDGDREVVDLQGEVGTELDREARRGDKGDVAVELAGEACWGEQECAGAVGEVDADVVCRLGGALVVAEEEVDVGEGHPHDLGAGGGLGLSDDDDGRETLTEQGDLGGATDETDLDAQGVLGDDERDVTPAHRERLVDVGGTGVDLEDDVGRQREVADQVGAEHDACNHRAGQAGRGDEERAAGNGDRDEGRRPVA